MMSQAKINSIKDAYEWASATPLLITLGVLAILIVLLIGAEVYKEHASWYNLDRLYPHIHNDINACQIICWILVACSFCWLFGVTINANLPTKKPSNPLRVRYVTTAVKYQKNLPKLEKGTTSNSNDFVTGSDNNQQIKYEKKFIHKYRDMKTIKKPTMKEYIFPKAFKWHHKLELNHMKAIR